MKTLLLAFTALSGLALATGSASAQIKVGFVTSLSGPGASIGTLYDQGMKAAYAYKSKVGDEDIDLIQLDDGSDPSTATQDARKLIEQEHVDILIGTATAPSTNAMMAVANELHVPFIAVSPVNVQPPATGRLWGVAMPQTPALMVKVIADKMKADGIKTAGYIGFSDAWGDLVYNGAKAAEADGDPTITTNERYARTDTSVTAQALKVLATKPDAVLIGGSATQAALPIIQLHKLGYKGPFYGTPAMLNADFVRVGGKDVEGVEVSAGPVIVTSQLPDDHFSKTIGTQFHEVFQKVNGKDANDGFSGYSFDGWLVFLNAAEKALKTAKPGTPEFREALLDGIYGTKDLAGVHSIYNFTPKSAYGVDARSLVVVKLEDGKWVYQP
ncbi:ABC transporter substrate-binding protein [Aurantimonas sp. MSK8Z-1]|uniref:ABC transporter substrate-binding protein n=1 Tax=Mangrovibrevibacter kandeliae TaxID=2968473 RepID=UPI0021182632|nr:ABC transporter substrate-binding protein [Aurantimonas sp. MSK8Z-1]MCW4115217.1 ABC transporter substrate-binding protein [Aurantimonas sp. MSK8Z-1]